MDNAIKPIETIYNGYRFRSRLEARWAVVFDALNASYKYEPEGFELGDLGWYLPDFWLDHYCGKESFPGWGYWVEIKPTQATEDELARLMRVYVGTNHNGLLIQGNPHPGEFAISKIQIMHKPKPEIWSGWEHILETYSYGDIEQLQRAFIAARQARFEHGEMPRGQR